MAALSPAARALLDHVDAQGGTGATEAAATATTVRPGAATTPVEELLAARLLVPRGDGLVQVPGEVGLALRGGRTTREPVDAVPGPATTERASALVDRTASGAAFEAVRRVELLLDQWGTTPPAALRSGGLGVRELKAAAALLHVDETTTALLVEVAAAAGLLAQGVAPDGEGVWLPTDSFDVWCGGAMADRWVELAVAWLASPRLPGLVGTRDQAGKGVNALAPELASTFQVESRRMTLDCVGRAARRRGPGERHRAAVAGGPGGLAAPPPAAGARPAGRLGGERGGAARRRRPRRALHPWPRPGRRRPRGRGRGALAPLLPEPVDHILLQADLTAVAPGPLESSVGRTLHLLADVESRGGATVYRFTASSVRRAFDAGWSAAEVHDFIGSISRTAVPQPLSYLVDDTARTFGTLRVGPAEAFLRADDEAALSELLHHPKASGLGLRRLAPTVLVSSVPLDVLLPRLRDIGAGPVVEAADGSVRVARPDQLRARSPRGRRASGQQVAREATQVTAAVSAVRAGDRAAEVRPAQAAEPTSPSSALTLLRAAVESGGSVLIGYVDNHGSSSERMVVPLRVEGGQLDRPRPPQRRHPQLRDPSDHDRPPGGGRALTVGRTVSGWTSSGTPTPRRTWSTRCSRTPPRSARC